MIFLSVLLGMMILAILAQEFMHYEELKDLANKHYEERQILLNRIQDPEFKPPTERLSPAEKRANMEEIRRLQEEAEQYGLVGQIVE